MKNKYIIACALASVLCVANASAQSLNVNCGNVTYSFNSAQTGVMQYIGGNSVLIQGKSFSLDQVGVMTVVDDNMDDNLVAVNYNGGYATVTVAGNVAQYVGVQLNGAHVSITQLNEVDDTTCGEITYSLAGESNNGSFTVTGAYKASVELHGVTLANPNGAAVDIEIGKRVALRVCEGTVNNLTDGAGTQKAALYCKGHLEIKQKGTLNVTGNAGHGISAKEYIQLKNATVNILKSVKDGVNCNQYFQMDSGSLSIANSGDDGIQVSYKDETAPTAEDTGAITINGGTLDIIVDADACKALKSDGDFVMSNGTINATVNGGGVWDSTKLKTKASSCLGVGGNLNISGGNFTLVANGGGGKGISVDGNLNISGGNFKINTYGGMMAYVNGVINNNYTGNADNLNSDYKSSPKGIKVDGELVIDGGSINIQTKGNGGEGMESKKTLTVNDGTIVIFAYEDGTNSSSHTYLKGGSVQVVSKTGDAIDSNGAIYVSGGNIRVIGAGGSEQGFDAGDNYTIYFTGGTMMASGGGNSAPTTTNGSSQAYVTLSQSVTAGQTVNVSLNGTVLASFLVPEAYDSATAKAPMYGPGGGGWGWGGSTGSALLLSCPQMVNGTTYTITVGTTTTTSVAKTTGGSTGPGIR